MKLTERKAGILLHPVSLPSDDGIGDFGKSAYDFLDFMADAGMGIWQVLPLGPTAYGDSPYTALSSFAGNPLLISLDRLMEEGLLDASDLRGRPEFSPDRVDYPKVTEWKRPLLEKAARRFSEESEGSKHGEGDSRETLRQTSRQEFRRFCEREGWWLDDYALFAAAKRFFDDMAVREGGKDSAWNLYWPEGLIAREPRELESRREEWAPEISIEKVLQFFFSRQWRGVKKYANDRGIRLFGDIPIFVSPESADVWTHPELFKLDKKHRPTVVAGVPPDYFSVTGQRWGNPVYNWAEHERTGFEWWISRIRKSLEQVDLVRIDHFRGFEAYWEIPATEKTAIKGIWKKSPGRELFHKIHEALGELPVVAEDLGVITPEVLKLREEFHIPGMKVLQFAFESDGAGALNANNSFLPHNYSPDYIAYTGTHDNDTTRGWFDALNPEQQNLVRSYLGSFGGDQVWEAIRAVFMSVACYAVVPFQDILGLGNDARMNTPATVGGHWSWRVRSNAFNPGMSGKLRWFARLYGRLGCR